MNWQDGNLLYYQFSLPDSFPVQVYFINIQTWREPAFIDFSKTTGHHLMVDKSSCQVEHLQFNWLKINAFDYKIRLIPERIRIDRPGESR